MSRVLLIGLSIVLVACLFARGSLVSASEEITQLQIGVKKRVTCERGARDGDKLSMHYDGKLLDGTVFDSSRKRNTPFDFTLGRGMVIKGWDMGLQGACIGEIRKLKIPYTLAYGERGMPPTIPEKAALIFEVEVMNITPGVNEPSMDQIPKVEF